LRDFHRQLFQSFKLLINPGMLPELWKSLGTMFMF